MSFDSYSNSIEIYIKDANGTNFSIQNLALGNPTGSNLRSPEYVQFVDSVTVNLSVLRFNTIDVVLKPTFEQARNLIRSQKLGLGFNFADKSKGSGQTGFAKKVSNSFGVNKLLVRLISGNKQSPWFVGMLLVPEFQISEDNIEIRLKATGLLNFTRQRGSSKAINGKTYKNVVEDLSKDKSGSYIIRIQKGDSKAEQQLSKIFNGNIVKKDWDAVKDILRQGNLRYIDHGVNDKDDKLVITLASTDFLKKQKPKMVLTAFKNINMNKGVYPILSMNTSLVNYIAGQAIEATANNISEDSKEIRNSDSKSKIGPQTSKKFSDSVRTSNKTLPGKDAIDKSSEGKRIMTPVLRENDSYLQKIEGYWQELVDNPLTYEVVTVGIPDALPGRPVNVNIGDIEFLSGQYDCFNIQHMWSQAGSQTVFELSTAFGLASALDELIQPIENKIADDAGSSDRVVTSRNLKSF